jgi:hypothetical protein
MNDIFGFGFLVVSLGFATLGCDEKSPARPGVKWLEECHADEDCGSKGSCLCGRCTVACTDSCDDGPAGTECTRTAGCGTIESGVCVERCVRTTDCADGLACRGGLCAASRGDDARAPDAEAFPGEHYTGTNGAWARTLRGYAHVPPGWSARHIGGTPLIAPGPDGDLIALVTVDVTLSKGDIDEYLTDDWLIRLDGETGIIEWVESVPTSSRMAVDPSGNVILAWPTLIQKLDPAGTLRWVKERAPELDYEHATVAVDGAGNVLVARLILTESPGEIGGDPKGFIELEKLDPDGNEVFSRRAGDESGLLDSPFVAADASNNVILLAGVVESQTDFGGGALVGTNVIAKYDPNGQHVFSKALGGYPDMYTFRNPLQTSPEGVHVGEIDCFQYLFELDGAGAPLSNRCLFIDDYTLMPQGGIATANRVFDPITVGGNECMPAGLEADGGLVARYDEAFNLVGHYCNADLGALPEKVLAASPDHLFFSGVGFLRGRIPGGIGFPDGGYFVAKIPAP